MSWLEQTLYGIRKVLSELGELPERPAIRFVGATVTDDAAAGETVVSISPFTGSVGANASVQRLVAEAATTDSLGVDALTIPIPSGAFASVHLLVVARDTFGGRRTFRMMRTCESVAGVLVGGVTTVGTDVVSGSGAHAVTFVPVGGDLVIHVGGVIFSTQWLVIADVRTVTQVVVP